MANIVRFPRNETIPVSKNHPALHGYEGETETTERFWEQSVDQIRQVATYLEKLNSDLTEVLRANSAVIASDGTVAEAGPRRESR